LFFDFTLKEKPPPTTRCASKRRSTRGVESRPASNGATPPKLRKNLTIWRSTSGRFLLD